MDGRLAVPLIMAMMMIKTSKHCNGDNDDDDGDNNGDNDDDDIKGGSEWQWRAPDLQTLEGSFAFTPGARI